LTLYVYQDCKYRASADEMLRKAITQNRRRSHETRFLDFCWADLEHEEQKVVLV
jgi:hypothetical protein